jgi:DNA-binding NarL/FixJ family response regulator
MTQQQSNYLSFHKEVSDLTFDTSVGTLTLQGECYKIFPLDDHETSNAYLRYADYSQEEKTDANSSSIVGYVSILNKTYIILSDTLERFGDAVLPEAHVKRGDQKNLDPLDLLTERELQISKFAAKGLSNKEIATQIGISEWTISTHLRRIYAKLSVSNRTAMVHKCFGK